MAHPLIQPRNYRSIEAVCHSLIGRMVYACGGNFFGIIRAAERSGEYLFRAGRKLERIIVSIESSEGKNVDAWADECSTNENAAKAMRGAALMRKAIHGS